MGQFYKLNVSTFRWEKLVGLECPVMLVERCHGISGRGRVPLLHLLWEHVVPSLDDRGVECLLCEYHFVTFQIDFNDETVENISFPGVELEPRVISRRKCYAPAQWDLGAAFAMDVYLPQGMNLSQHM
ncbi:hypothetical protein LIER_05258 [Lithospermum erythrorhizon]|uniref:Uncharacterized protein n=1 Tax=Lithospermum erythrorhizon TaxID=34254 RepID=A0AAV3P171_LITER